MLQKYMTNQKQGFDKHSIAAAFGTIDERVIARE
jgi:hypothetical protein